MIFKSKKIETERLKALFGKVKDDYYDFEKVEAYFRNKDNSKAFQVISDKTCNDMDFDELFMYLDRTNSKVGQQYLYSKLRTIPSKSEDVELSEEIIKELSGNLNFRLKVQRLLEKLKMNDAYYITSLFQEEHLKTPKWFPLIKLLSLASFTSLLLIPFFPGTMLVLIGIFIINMGIHYWNKKNLFKYSNSIPQLLRLNKVAGELYKNKLLQKIDNSVPESITVINQIKNRMSFFQLEAMFLGDLEIVFWTILELLKTLFLLDPLLLFGVLKRLNTKREEIENVFSFVGQVDSLFSIASLRDGQDSYCVPKINTENSNISSSEIYHPLIYKCTKNSINISDKSILLTGSNMSGKTSFIRTIGVNVLTGLTINTCFANSISIPKTKIFSAIRINDDLMNDKSYYFEEVLTIKEMLKESNNDKMNLFLLDEIFKGTNTVERISAGKAVLSELSGNNNTVLVSTHDIELTDLLFDEYELYHFSGIVEDKTVNFDYRLKAGKLKNRNAIRILQINDYPESVINEALEISEKLDKITMTDTVYT
ncbi:MAG: DNA mismatch repair protein MutS [Bacteroidota bacterium]